MKNKILNPFLTTYLILFFYLYIINSATAQTDLMTLPYTIISNNVVAGQTQDLGGGIVQLTKDIGEDASNPWQSSAMWGNSKIDLDYNFELEIDMYFGCNFGEWGGDGIVFLLHDDPRGTSAIGGGGGFLGCGGNISERVSPSYGIEFDTYDGSVWGGTDIPADHITVIQNSFVSNNVDPLEIGSNTSIWGPTPISRDLESCVPSGNDYYSVKIEWIAPNTLNLYEGGNLIFSLNLDRSKFTSNMVYWGFTAGTGNASNEQWIAPKGSYIPWNCTMTGCCLGQSVTTNNPAAVCFPNTVDLTKPIVTAGSTSGMTFTYWMDSAATIPYTTPSEATEGIYYIKGTSTSGCFDIKPVTVTVNPLPTYTFESDYSICKNDSVTLTLTLSGTSPFYFEYTDGTNSEFFTNYNNTNWTRTISPSATTKYSIKNVKDKNCYSK